MVGQHPVFFRNPGIFLPCRRWPYRIRIVSAPHRSSASLIRPFHQFGEFACLTNQTETRQITKGRKRLRRIVVTMVETRLSASWDSGISLVGYPQLVHALFVGFKDFPHSGQSIRPTVAPVKSPEPPCSELPRLPLPGSVSRSHAAVNSSSGALSFHFAGEVRFAEDVGWRRRRRAPVRAHHKTRLLEQPGSTTFLPLAVGRRPIPRHCDRRQGAKCDYPDSEVGENSRRLSTCSEKRVS